MFDKNTLVAFLLIAVILIFLPIYTKYVNPQPEIPTGEVLPVPPTSTPTNTIISNEYSSAPKTKTSLPVEASIVPQNSIEEKKIVLSNNLFYLTLSNMGGGTISQVQLKKYNQYDGNLVTLIPENSIGNLGISLLNTLNDTSSFNHISFNCSNFDLYNNLDTVEVKGAYKLDFVLNINKQQSIIKHFTFYPDVYEFDMTVDLEGFQHQIPNNEYSLEWNSGFSITEKNAKDDMMYSYLYSKVGEEIIDQGLKDKIQAIKIPGDIKWASVRSKYFSASIIPISNDGKSIYMSGHKDADNRYFKSRLTMAFSNNTIHSDVFKIVISPLDDEYLKSFGIGLEKMMNWGWKLIQPISKGVLWSLKFLHSFIPNYGIVLIIFSILIKLILYPLTHKSYESMKKMQDVQPLMVELKEKHKNNPEALNKETMALYKKHGVNPMGGCLPMLFQMPLLYSLFIVFRTTIELRGAHFMFWIKDLSSPDVIFTLPFTIPLYGNGISVLPVVMAVTMVLQQKLTGSKQQTDQQKMMMYMMPVMFLLIFNNFPSGLNLYYTLFNLLTIIQQKYFINPSIKPIVLDTPDKAKKSKKRK